MKLKSYFRRFLAGAITLLVILGFTNKCLAKSQGESFTVESFIPEKFIDLKLKIDGDLDFSGSDNEFENNYFYPEYDSKSDREIVSSSQRLNLSGVFSYTNQTVKRTLHSSLDLFVSGSGYASESGYASDNKDVSSQDFYDQRSITDTERTSRENLYAISYDIGGEYYIFDDLFISTHADNYMRFSNTPKNNEDRTLTQTRVDTVGSIPYQEYRLTDSKDHRDSRGNAYSADIQLNIGWGRSYEGKFASISLYIIDELQKRNLIKNNLSKEEMMHLTGIIYQYKQKHAIDSRIRRIDAVDSIGNFLIEKGAITGKGPETYSIIQDIWSYFPYFDREFGWNIRVGAGYEYEYKGNEGNRWERTYTLNTFTEIDNPGVVDTLYETIYSYHDYTKTRKTQSLPFFTAAASYHKPFNHKWQLDASASGRFYFEGKEEETSTPSIGPADETDEKTQIDFKDHYRIDCSIALRYIMNSRSTASLTGLYDSYRYKSSSKEFKETFRRNELSISPSLEYRIAIPTILRLGLTYRIFKIYSDGENSEYGWDRYINDQNNRDYFVNLSVSHYIFDSFYRSFAALRNFSSF